MRHVAAAAVFILAAVAGWFAMEFVKPPAPTPVINPVPNPPETGSPTNSEKADPDGPETTDVANATSRTADDLDDRAKTGQAPVRPTQTASEPPRKPDTVVNVTITNIKDAKGTLMVSLYDSPTGWARDMKSQKCENEYQQLKVPAKADSVEFVFEKMPPGTYAISMYHDVDDSGAMTMKFLGTLPAEPFGFSNDYDPFTNLGAPKLSDCKFEVEAGNPTSVAIRLQ